MMKPIQLDEHLSDPFHRRGEDNPYLTYTWVNPHEVVRLAKRSSRSKHIFPGFLSRHTHHIPFMRIQLVRNAATVLLSSFGLAILASTVEVLLGI